MFIALLKVLKLILWVIKMGKVKTKQIVVLLLVASFLFSCSKNIQTTPFSTVQSPAKKITTQKKSLIFNCGDEDLKKQLEPYKQYLLEDNYYANMSVGRIHYSCGEYKKAIEHFEKHI